VNGHPQFDEDFDLYALGALEGEERQDLELHLRTCVDCGRKLEEARGRMALLALAVPPQSAPAAVRDRLLRQVSALSRVSAEEPRRRLGLYLLRWVTPALALTTAVLAFTVGFLTSRNQSLNRRLRELESSTQQAERRQEAGMARARAILDVLTSSETTKVTLLAAGARPAPEGKAFYHAQKGLLFYVANLPSLPSSQTYQLWLVPDTGSPISAGIFSTDPKGNGQIVLPPLPSGVRAKAFAVTIEPAGGVPQPTGPKVLIGAAS
jgi:anti-sigma-K factor RskA